MSSYGQASRLLSSYCALQETPTSPLSASCVLSSSVSTGSGHASPTTSSVSNLVLPEVVSAGLEHMRTAYVIHTNSYMHST